MIDTDRADGHLEDPFDLAFELLENGEEDPERILLARFPSREDEVRVELLRARRYRARLLDGESWAAPGPEQPSGTVLADFEVVALQGQGNMGRVYRARQISLGGREVALKLLPPDLLEQDPKLAERFRREATLAAEVHHPNLAEIYASGEEDGQLYFAMRLVEGPNLEEVCDGLVARRRAAELNITSDEYVRIVVDLVRRVSAGLAALHARGLVHRDVKPSNVVLEGPRDDELRALRSRPVLVDFGLLRSAGSSTLTATGQLMRTPAYASPEANLGRDVQPGADVFSLGVVLHDLLALTAPGERSLASAGLPEVRGLNTAVDERLAAILRMATEADPTLRYPDAGVLEEELGAYLENEPIRALPTKPVARLRLWARRDPHRALRTGAAIVLLLPLLASAGWLASWVRGTYALGAAIAAGEQAGDLAGARTAALELLTRSSALQVLPGLARALERAHAYEGPFGALVRELESREERTLRLAHSRLQRLILTPGQDEWDELALAFLTHEIARLPDGSARQLAAETASAYMVVHPLSSDWRDAGQVVAGLGSKAKVRRAVWESLRAALVEAAVAREDTAAAEGVRLQAVAALSGITDLDVFAALVRIVREDEGELRRLALGATTRMWWQLEMDGAVSRIPDQLLTTWTESILTGDRFESALADPLGLCAWTALRRGHVTDRSPVWSRLEAQDRRLLLNIQDVFRAYQETGDDPLPAVPFTEPWQREGMDWFRPKLTRARFEKRWIKESHPFDYDNIWTDLAADAPAAIVNPTPELAEHASVHFREARPVFGGSALEASWTGGRLHGDPNFEYFEYRQVESGIFRFRFRFDVPPQEGSKYLRVSLAFLRAARFHLPNEGNAWVRVGLGTGETLEEFRAPIDRSWRSLSIDRDLLNGRDEVELVVRLVSGTTTCRLLGIDVGLEEVIPAERFK